MYGTTDYAWQGYAAEMTTKNCGSLVHSSGSGYGENLYMCWGGGGNCYNDKGAMKSLCKCQNIVFVVLFLFFVFGRLVFF